MCPADKGFKAHYNYLDFYFPLNLTKMPKELQVWVKFSMAVFD